MTLSASGALQCLRFAPLGQMGTRTATTADRLLAKASVVTVPLAPTASQRVRYERTHFQSLVQQHHMIGAGVPLEGQYQQGPIRVAAPRWQPANSSHPLRDERGRQLRLRLVRRVGGIHQSLDLQGPGQCEMDWNVLLSPRLGGGDRKDNGSQQSLNLGVGTGPDLDVPRGELD